MPDVTHNEAEQKWEYRQDGQLAFLTYMEEGEKLFLLHTDVPKELEGHGIGSKLVRAAADDAVARDRKLVPFCPFARAWLERHPEYAAHVAEGR